MIERIMQVLTPLALLQNWMWAVIAESCLVFPSHQLFEINTMLWSQAVVVCISLELLIPEDVKTLKRSRKQGEMNSKRIADRINLYVHAFGI